MGESAPSSIGTFFKGPRFSGITLVAGISLLPLMAVGCGTNGVEVGGTGVAVGSGTDVAVGSGTAVAVGAGAAVAVAAGAAAGGADAGGSESLPHAIRAIPSSSDADSASARHLVIVVPTVIFL